MIYLEVNDILFIHNEFIEKFGGLGGVKDIQQIESILQHIQNDEYYKGIIEKSCHLFFGIIKFHCFNDGNKRTSIGTLNIFWKLNGINIENIYVKLEDIAIGVAKGEISKSELNHIFKSMFISFGYNNYA